MRAILLAGLVAAVSAVGVGCKPAQAPAPAAEPASVSGPMERKTVHTAEKSPDDIRGLMTQWNQEGWRVLSFSKVTTQADGTITRTVDLARPRK